MENIKQFLGNGLYLDVSNCGYGFENKLEEKLNVPQTLVLKCSMDDMLAVDRRIQPKVLYKLEGGHRAYFDLSKKCKTEKDFYELLTKYVIEMYPTPWDGQFTRPLTLEVDPRTVRLSVKDVAKVNSEKNGSIH